MEIAVLELCAQIQAQLGKAEGLGVHVVMKGGDDPLVVRFEASQHEPEVEEVPALAALVEARGAWSPSAPPARR